MKGLRLYAHEKRYAASYGERGLQVSAAHFERLQRARRDVGFLTSRELVDYSYLLSVFPTDAPRRAVRRRRARADYHAGDFDGRAASGGGGGLARGGDAALGRSAAGRERRASCPQCIGLQPAEAAAPRRRRTARGGATTTSDARTRRRAVRGRRRARRAD